MQIYAGFLGSFCIFRTISYPSERLLYLLAGEGVGVTTFLLLPAHQ